MSGEEIGSLHRVEAYPGLFLVRRAKKKVINRIAANKMIRPMGRQLLIEKPSSGGGVVGGDVGELATCWS